MNNWPRRATIIVIIALTAFSVAIVPGAAEVVDSDTTEVGLIVTRECSGQPESMSPLMIAYTANGQVTDVGPVLFAQEDADDDTPCPDEPVDLIPNTADCPGRAEFVSPAMIAYAANGQVMDVGPVLFAQADAEDDTPCPDEPVDLIPNTADCPGRAESVSPVMIAYAANGQVTDVGPVLFAQADADDDAPCPDEPVDPEPVASVGGGNSQVPSVSQLPETGVSPPNAASPWTLTTVLAAGLLLMGGGLLNSRTKQSRRGR